MITFGGVKKRLKERQTIFIYEREVGEDEVEQWFYDGVGYYLIHGLPTITSRDQLLSMMDVKEKDKDKYHFDILPFPKYLNVEAFCTGDMEAQIGDDYQIGKMLPVFFSTGTMLIDSKALTPVKDEEGTEYFVRRQSIPGTDANLLCVREDMFGLSAIIIPYRMEKLQETDLCNTLDRISIAIRASKRVEATHEESD